MPAIKQAAFIGGEIAPELHGRSDLAAYGVALRTCRNMLILPQGGAASRPGTKLVRAVKDSTKTVRLIPFVFNESQAYVLEFGHQYIRFHADGGTIEDPGSPGTPLELASPWTEAQLPRLKFAQVNDILTVVHNEVHPQEIQRNDHDDWAIANYTLTRPGEPTSVVRVSGASAAEGDADSTHHDKEWAWVVTAVDETGRESLPSNPYTRTDAVLFPDKEPTIIAWTPPVGVTVDSYNVYRGRNGVYGWVGSSKTNEFTDDAVAPDYGTGPPQNRNPINLPLPLNYPASISYFEQRLVFGGTYRQRSTLHLTRTGDFKSFDQSAPLKDDDAIELALASNRMDEIRDVMPSDALLVFTAGAIWKLAGGNNGPLTPTSFDVDREIAHGISWLSPLDVGTSILFVEDRGQRVREVLYSLETDGLTAPDVSILARHLLVGRSVSSWAYARAPYGIIWLARSDGALIGLTYDRDNNVAAWHRHDTDGTVEQVCTVPEGNEDAVYLVVRRIANGNPVRYIERMATREWTSADLAVTLDSAVSYDGWNADTNQWLRLTTATDWTSGTEMTLSTGGYSGPAGAPFVAGDVGQVFYVRGDDEDGNPDTVYARVLVKSLGPPDGGGNILTCTVEALEAVPASAQDTETTDWARAVNSVSGLGHLEGRTVSVVVDGGVHPARTVSSGSIALDVHAARIHAGLPYTCEMETLDVAVSADVQVRQKRIVEVWAQVQASGPFFIGPDRDHLDLVDAREVSSGFGPPPLVTDLVRAKPRVEARRSGGFVIQQPDPVPLKVLSILPDLEVSRG